MVPLRAVFAIVPPRVMVEILPPLISPGYAWRLMMTPTAAVAMTADAVSTLAGRSAMTCRAAVTLDAEAVDPSRRMMRTACADTVEAD